MTWGDWFLAILGMIAVLVFVLSCFYRMGKRRGKLIIERKLAYFVNHEVKKTFELKDLGPGEDGHGSPASLLYLVQVLNRVEYNVRDKGDY